MKQKYLIIAATLVGIITILLLFLGGNTGKLVLKGTNTPGNVTISVTLSNDDEKTVTETVRSGDTKTLKLAKGTWRIDSVAASQRSVDVVTIGGDDVELTVPNGEKRAIEQKGSDAKVCSTVTNDVVYSYDCGTATTVVRHDPGPLNSSLNTTIFGGRSFGPLTPLKTGFLEIATVEEISFSLNYVDLPTQTIQSIVLPKEVQDTLLTYYPQVAVPYDPGGASFALLFSQTNTIYLFKDITDQNPVKIQPAPDKLNQAGRVNSISYYNDHLLVFLGIGHDESGEGTIVSADATEEAHDPNLAIKLLEYDAEGKQVSSLDMSEDVGTQAMYRLSEDFYGALTTSSFNVYHRAGEELNEVYALNDVSSWTVLEGKTYIVASGTVYEFLPRENGLFSLHGLFTSSPITVASMSPTMAGIFFTGLVGETSTAKELHLYQLLAAGEGNPDDNKHEPFYTGLEQLRARGITSEQLNRIKLAINTYIESTSKEVDRVGIVNVTLAPHDRYSAADDTAVFDVVFDGDEDKGLDGRLEYSGLVSTRVVLADSKTGAQLFDSGVLQ